MAIKHLKPHTKKEVLEKLREKKMDNELIEACYKNDDIYKLVTDYLNLRANLAITGIEEKKRMEQLNMVFKFFKVFSSHTKNNTKQV